MEKHCADCEKKDNKIKSLLAALEEERMKNRKLVKRNAANTSSLPRADMQRYNISEEEIREVRGEKRPASIEMSPPAKKPKPSGLSKSGVHGLDKSLDLFEKNRAAFDSLVEKVARKAGKPSSTGCRCHPTNTTDWQVTLSKKKFPELAGVYVHFLASNIVLVARLKGKLARGLHCSHLCHNPMCVEPSHLVAEDPKSNTGRNACKECGNCSCTNTPSCFTSEKTDFRL